MLESGNAAHGLLDRTGDGHFHLLDGHDAVVDADDDAWEIRRRKHGYRKVERFVNSDDRQNDERRGGVTTALQ